MDKTLLKGLSMLEMLVESSGEVRSVEDVAAMTGLSRSNAHRTLQTLISAGYVEKSLSMGGYRSTLKMFELGARQMQSLDVRKLAHPFISQLAKESGETAHLSVLDGLDVIYIDKVDSLQPIRAYSRIGGRGPAYAVATGKALLAAQGEKYLEAYKNTLERFTPQTIDDFEALKIELAKIRRIGYAVNRGEWREGVGGVAAVIYDGFDAPVAAIGLSGPLDRLSVVRMKDLAPKVLGCSQELSKALGYRRGYFGESV